MLVDTIMVDEGVGTPVQNCTPDDTPPGTPIANLTPED